MISEADTCRKFVVPKLYDAGWADEQILEQRSLTDGRIMVSGSKVWRKAPKRADYLLRHKSGAMLAVVEAKALHKTPAAGLQQAKEYARMLDLKFAYAARASSSSTSSKARKPPWQASLPPKISGTASRATSAWPRRTRNGNS